MLNDIQRVGFACLGAMGAGIAQRLMGAGYEVVGWNRTTEKAQPLLDAGMGWAETPRELGASVDVAGLGEGTVWADISTIAPDASVALAERVRALARRFSTPLCPAAPPRSPPVRCR